MTKKNLPSPEYLRKRLRYEPETGKLFWLYCDEMPREWQTRYSGHEAFTTVGGNGYCTGSVNKVTLYAHRVIWVLHSGEWPDGQIDHINGTRTDNRIKNLRVVSNEENSRNSAMSARNTSGVVGVSWSKKRGMWRSEVVVNKATIILGYFNAIEDAAAIRADASRKYGFSERHGAKVAS
jgi:hypothetical protein